MLIEFKIIESFKRLMKAVLLLLLFFMWLALSFKQTVAEVGPTIWTISTIHKKTDLSKTKDKLVDVEEKKLLKTNFSDVTPLKFLQTNTSSERVCSAVLLNVVYCTEAH